MKLLSLAVLGTFALNAQPTLASPTQAVAATLPTRTPIKHLIVVIGENVTFDTLFATYTPPAGQSVNNLLSQGIVNSDGSPGSRYYRAAQWRQQNLFGKYTVDPIPVAPYPELPTPTLIGAYNPATLQPYPAIPDPRYARLVTNGPFQITGTNPDTGQPYVTYGSATSATGDPVHRFFQMWQQTGGTNRDLKGFAWTAVTTGQGGDTPCVVPPGQTPDPTQCPGAAPGPGQGAELMGFFNMATGDAPVFKSLASHYALSDNYHQAIMGGTGANFFALATGDLPVFTSAGAIAVPPANQIENPNPRTGTEDFFSRDGYSGGSYVNCSDPLQPGVAAVTFKLLTQDRRPNCAAGAYYLVNNYTPPFDVNGSPVALGADQYVYPPQRVPTIGEALSKRGVSWSWYTGGREDADISGDPLYQAFVYPQVYAQVYAAVLAQLTAAGYPSDVISSLAPGIAASKAGPIAIATARPLLYNNIGDPMNASATVVSTPELQSNLKGLTSFYNDVAGNSLPAVSWVVPKNLDSGHPGYSAPPRYEAFVSDLIARVQASAAWDSTAILITTDEGGGYFDSGRIQLLDFFGDGPRIPLILVSKYARPGHVDHTYNDHASILKFIERNWSVPVLSSRSRDRLPNPEDGGYIPEAGPAIGDLSTLFDFRGQR
jgi:phospholipase C